MRKEILDVIVCPVTKAPLHYDAANNELVSASAKLAYPIRNDVPILVRSEARSLE